MAKSYTDIATKLPEFREMAKLVFMSQMIAGIKDADMAFMVLMECEMTGQRLFEWSEENHIVGTRPTMKYDAMIASYNQLPNCKFEFIEKTPERCAVKLTDNGIEKTFSLTWEELQKESVPYNGKESEVVAALAAGNKPKLKDKYATPRSRAVMMYARLVSDAIRSTRPEVTKGRYTPEEVEDFDEVKTVDAVSTARVVEPARIAATPLKAEPVKAEPAKAEPAKAEPAKAEPIVEQPAIATEPAATTEEQPAGSLVGVSELHLSDACSPEQVNQMRLFLSDLKKAGTDLFPAVKAKLAASKIDGLAGMTVAEADALLAGLKIREIKNWAESQLKGSANPS